MENEKENINRLLADFVKRIGSQNKKFTDDKSGLAYLLNANKLDNILLPIQQSLMTPAALASMSSQSSTSETYTAMDVENLPVSKLLL